MTSGAICPERAAITPAMLPPHGVTCPVCNRSPGQWCLTVADTMVLLAAALRELRLVRAGWQAHLAGCNSVVDPRTIDEQL